MPNCDVYRYERIEQAAERMAKALEMAKNTVECDSLDKDGNHLPWYRSANLALAYWAAAKKETS
jgi:hypothetical protein